jgi:hypothetical protein
VRSVSSRVAALLGFGEYSALSIVTGIVLSLTALVTGLLFGLTGIVFTLALVVLAVFVVAIVNSSPKEVP